MRALIGALIAAVLMVGAGAASAQTITTNATGQIVNINDGGELSGMAIQPPSALPLQSYTLYLRRSTLTFSVTPIIYEWNGATSVGAPVWTGAPVSVTNATFDPYTFTPGIVLDPTKEYVLGVLQTVPGEAGQFEAQTVNNIPGYLAYRDNPVWTPFNAIELHFTAVFAAPVATVPTLSEWAMILFGAALAGGALVAVYRRRISRAA